MSGTGPADDDRGSLAVFKHVVERCDRYEAAWREGRRPRIEDYLAEAPEPERALLLRELLALELELRSSGGERPEPQEYRQRFPGHVELINRILNETDPSAPVISKRQLDPIKSGGNPPLRKNYSRRHSRRKSASPIGPRSPATTSWRSWATVAWGWSTRPGSNS